MANIEFTEIIKSLKTVIKSLIDVSDFALRRTADFYKIVHIKKKTVFHRPESIFNYAMFIGKGILRSFYITPEAKEITYFFYRENEFVSDFESFILQQPSKYFFETLEDCICIRINYDDIQKIYASDFKFQKLGRIIAENSYLRTEERLRMFMTQDLELRYKNILKNDPQLIDRIPQYYLASYLGVSGEALSRLKSKF